MRQDEQPRERAVRRLTKRLKALGQSRWQMFFIMLVTGAAGCFFSHVLQGAGVTSMAVRYPVAVGLSYMIFLGLVFLLVMSIRGRHHRAGTGGGGGTVDPVGDVFQGVTVQSQAGGTGATASFTDSGNTGGGSTSGGSSGGGSFDFGGADGDGAVVVVVLFVVIAIGIALVCSLLIVFEGPALLAQALVDGIVVGGLARRAKTDPGPHWTTGLVSRTILPFAAVACFFGLVGWCLEHVVPGAHSIGEAMVRVQSGSPSHGR